MTCSIITGMDSRAGIPEGSIRTIPFRLGNHSSPDADRAPAGCMLPLISLVSIPSLVPYGTTCKVPGLPSGASSSLRRTADTPAGLLSHNLPLPSSRI